MKPKIKMGNCKRIRSQHASRFCSSLLSLSWGWSQNVTSLKQIQISVQFLETGMENGDDYSQLSPSVSLVKLPLSH